jgi:hypothetical protein
MVRLTRPEVVLSWMPAYAAGENHGDHQAAAVLATEAFDMSADPTVFPEQVTPARDHAVSGNLTEGLQPWQAKKLYFFSDAANAAALDGKGPQYPWDEVSPSRKAPYGRLALESIANHRTQDYPGLLAAAALKGDPSPMYKQYRTRLVLGKSHVPGAAGADVFDGVEPGPIPFQRSTGYAVETRSGLSAELGGPWAFYRQFWRAHDLTSLVDIFGPEVRVGMANDLNIPVLLRNDTESPAEFEIAAVAPEGWGTARGIGVYPVKPHQTRAVEIAIPAIAKEQAAQQVRVSVRGPTGKIADLSLSVTVAKSALPQ